jgi:SAM-dependent methyltransferase
MYDLQENLTVKFPLVSRKRFENLRKERDFTITKLASVSESLAIERQRVAEELSSLANAIGLSGLSPIAICRNQSEWNRFRAADVFQRAQEMDKKILHNHKADKEWVFFGYSAPADCFVRFGVDMLSGGENRGDVYVPNLRERLVCPVTGLNNRQRLMATLLSAELTAQPQKKSVYLMEQLSETYNWAARTFQLQNIIGSEYLADGLQPGAKIDGVRHEDAQRLSFPDASLDLVVSNDVMEHVPSAASAFRELARVMRPGAQALMTFPFFSDRDAKPRSAALMLSILGASC